MTLGERLHQLRRRAHLTQSELAGQLPGYAQQQVSYWEQGQAVIPAALLPLLIAVLGVQSVDEFFQGVESVMLPDPVSPPLTPPEDHP